MFAAVRFLVYIVLYNLLTSMALSGVLPSVVSSLQRQYGFTATAMGTVLSLNDAIMIVLAIPIGYYGACMNKARVTAVGFVFAVIGILLFALAYLVSSSYTPLGNGNSEMCSASNTGR